MIKSFKSQESLFKEKNDKSLMKKKIEIASATRKRKKITDLRDFNLNSSPILNNSNNLFAKKKKI